LAQLLVGLLRDTHFKVRLAACVAIGRLCVATDNNPHFDKPANLITLAIPVLEKCLIDGSVTRQTVADTLAMAGGVGIQTLMAAADNPVRQNVQKEVYKALAVCDPILPVTNLAAEALTNRILNGKTELRLRAICLESL